MTSDCASTKISGLTDHSEDLIFFNNHVRPAYEVESGIENNDKSTIKYKKSIESIASISTHIEQVLGIIGLGNSVDRNQTSSAKAAHICVACLKIKEDFMQMKNKKIQRGLQYKMTAVDDLEKDSDLQSISRQI